MDTIFLGHCDVGRVPNNTKKFLQPYHDLGILKGTKSFRDEDRSKWRRFKERNGSEVTVLQEFLFRSGFMPRGVIDGIFDYVTQSSARLFQEYVRTVEGFSDMIPDGIVGIGTWKHIERWKSLKKVADWKKYTAQKPTEEFAKWIELLNSAKDYYDTHQSPILKQVVDFQEQSDTIKLADWTFDPNEIHLIGIRREQNISEKYRENNDIFVLLINGLVFKFWGSTDPSQAMAYNDKKKKGRKDEPFLVEGQHKYRFGWHKIWAESKVYRALRPYSSGVLVFRDRNDDNALTEVDIKAGLDSKPNKTINIHWSGIGTSNWSAGCQVIAGKSYINHLDQIVDCSKFAARNYSSLNRSLKKTKGAYSVLADLLISFSAPGIDHVIYTLGREVSLNINPNLGYYYAENTLKKMKGV